MTTKLKFVIISKCKIGKVKKRVTTKDDMKKDIHPARGSLRGTSKCIDNLFDTNCDDLHAIELSFQYQGTHKNVLLNLNAKQLFIITD